MSTKSKVLDYISVNGAHFDLNPEAFVSVFCRIANESISIVDVTNFTLLES